MSRSRYLACCSGLAALLISGSGVAAGDNDPSDPNAHVPRTHYHSVLSGYEYVPVPSEPGNWRELNDRMEQIGGPAGQLRDVDEPLRKKKHN